MARILITGATGFVGAECLLQGLAARPDDQWLCLVRAPDADAGRERLARRLSRSVGGYAARALAARVQVLPGGLLDVRPDAVPGLSEVTHVLHLAADTSWWAREASRRTNLDGTLALARLAGGMPALERFLHVGTAMICGAAPEPLVEEDAYPSRSAEHLVHYTRVKADAETALRLGFTGLPLVIARPSIVVGHTMLGALPSASILWMLRAGDRLRLLPCDAGDVFDAVPVDWAAGALLTLLRKPVLGHGTYHVSAGEAGRSTWAELGQVFSLSDADRQPRAYERFDLGSPGVLRRRFAETFGLSGPLNSVMLRAVRAYYRFCALGVTFDNGRLLAEGVLPPPPLAGYLDVCLSHPAGVGIAEQFADDMDMFGASSPRRGAPALAGAAP